MVENGASSDNNQIDIFSDILNHEGYQNCFIGSKVTATTLNGWILPTGRVALGIVCPPYVKAEFDLLAYLIT